MDFYRVEEDKIDNEENLQNTEDKDDSEALTPEERTYHSVCWRKNTYYDIFLEAFCNSAIPS